MISPVVFTTAVLVIKPQLILITFLYRVAFSNNRMHLEINARNDTKSSFTKRCYKTPLNATRK